MNTADVKSDMFICWLDDYATDILRLCYFYLGNQVDAEDALQDTFLKAWRHMEQYERRGLGNPKSWLMRIAVNTCRDRFRSAAWRHTDRTIQADDVLLHTAAPREDIDLLLDVKALPEKLKQAVLLYYYQRMTIEEIASILHVSASTVSRRLSKAVKLFAEIYEK